MKEIHVSVRNLVEFIMRSGDIDNRKTVMIEDSMQEGGRLHRMIQKQMGENYSSEVLLRYLYETPDYVLEIEGRADGIMQKQVADESCPYDQVMIDEIKCVGRNLDHLMEPIPVHLAQAKVYAYIYATQKALPQIEVQMTYCQFETEEIKYFNFDYSLEELASWFDALMKQYLKWTDLQFQWEELSKASIKEVVFPFPYREGQKDLAIYVYQSIRERKKLYLEAPTGVGKTITTVFPTIKSMGEGLTTKLFYLTAKTITRTVAENTFDILRKQGLRLKTITITAKEKICPLERTECNPVACPRAKGHYDRVNDAMYDLLMNCDRIDRDCLEEYATKYNLCPFEFSLDVSLFADAIICDYNYVFDPHASLKRYFSEGNHGEYTFLIDEAHNLVDRGREMFSATLYKEQFLDLKNHLKKAFQEQEEQFHRKIPASGKRMEKALERCNKEMLELKRICENCIVLESVEPLVRLLEGLYQAMSDFLENEDGGEIRQEVLDFYFEIAHFLMIYERLDENYCIYCEMQEDGRFMIKLFCVNPRNNLAEAMAKGRSSILFSATFLPIQYYKGLLGGEKEDYEVYAKSTFDPEKRGLFIANDVTSKYSMRNALQYQKIASYLHQVLESQRGNYMIFFPSYAFMNSVYESFMEHFYEESLMDVLVQEEHMDEAAREEFLRKFSSAGLLDVSHMSEVEQDKSLVGFCVLGGIFSEGIDLKQDSLIGTLIVGTGLPLICNEKELLRNHFDSDEKTEGAGFDYAYRYPGMNKVLQAAGRVIRTAEDIGIVLLLDDRFLGGSYRRLFPREWTNFRVVNTQNVKENLESFWKRHYF